MAQILFDSECQVAGKKGGNITFHERVSKFERKHVEFKWGDGFSSPLSFFSFFRFADFCRGIFFIVTFGKELERAFRLGCTIDGKFWDSIFFFLFRISEECAHVAR